MSGGELSRRAVVASAAALALMPRSARAAPSAVSAPDGIFDVSVDHGLTVACGIRYGRAARFQAPVAVSMPGQRVVAQTFGPVAPQQGARYGTQSEDCLFLNIWTAEARCARA